MAVPLVLALAMARGVRRVLSRSREDTLRTLAARSTVLVAAGSSDAHSERAHVAQPDTLFDAQLWARNVRDELAPVVEATVLDAASRAHTSKTIVAAAGDVQYGFDVSNPHMAAAVDAHVNSVASWGESFRSSVSDTVTRGMHDGWSNERIATELTDKGSLSDARAMAIARTETTAAANAGTIEGWSQSNDASGQPIVVTKTWLSTADASTRDSHAEADGQEVNIGDTFTVGGEDAMYPGDPDLSAGERVNCRCTMLSSDGSELSAEDAEDMTDEELAAALDGEPDGGLSGDAADASELLDEAGTDLSSADEMLVESGDEFVDTSQLASPADELSNWDSRVVDFDRSSDAVEWFEHNVSGAMQDGHAMEDGAASTRKMSDGSPSTLGDWESGMNGNVNTLLRGGEQAFTSMWTELTGETGVEALAEAHTSVSRMDAMFDSGQWRTKSDVVVWRGTNSAVQGAVGTVFVDEGFAATSTMRSISEPFIGGSSIVNPSAQQASLIEILIPGGTRVLTLGGGEAEMILPRGSRFEILERRSERGVDHVRVRLLSGAA